MRRFSYVLEWAGIVVIVSSVIVRGPLLLAYFRNVPDVLDYLPVERFIMCGLILAFCSMQVSLVLHNETLRAAFEAHKEFVRTNLTRVGWFFLIAAIHYFFLITCDAIVREAIGDRPVGIIGSLVAVIIESLGPLLRTVNQRRVFVANLAAQLNEQVFTGRCPGRGHEQSSADQPDVGGRDTGAVSNGVGPFGAHATS